MRVFFGHQSVGADLVQGLLDLRAEGSMPELKICETLAPANPQALLLAHARIGRNGDPRSKLADFGYALDAGVARWADLALFKLCYVDVCDCIAVGSLFEDYVRTIATLEARHPGVTIGHITVPLRAAPRGIGFRVRRLLGKRDPQHRCNEARTLFNERLRAMYRGRRPLFDLAAVESSDPSGRPVTWREGQEIVPALAAQYTDDGGHLNSLGRRLAARAFHDFLLQASSRL